MYTKTIKKSIVYFLNAFAKHIYDSEHTQRNFGSSVEDQVWKWL